MISSRTQSKDSGDRAVDAVSRTTAEQINQANAGGRTPVVFVHGLWRNRKRENKLVDRAHQ